MIYLASPYSHPDPLVRKTRFLLAEQATAILLNQGIFTFSPIVHCHALAERHTIPTDFAFWRGYNFDMLRRADLVSVLAIPGWKESVGVQAEIEMARAIGMQVTFINEMGEPYYEKLRSTSDGQSNSLGRSEG